MAGHNQPPSAAAQTAQLRGVSVPTAPSAPTMASSPTLDPRIEEAFAKFQADIARLQNPGQCLTQIRTRTCRYFRQAYCRTARPVRSRRRGRCGYADASRTNVAAFRL